MDPETPADDNKYTIGIAAFVCLLPLPALYFATRPLVSIPHASGIPWLITLLFVLPPPLTAFITLYWGAWQHDWPRAKRILLSVFMSCIIFGADLLLLGYAITFLFVFGNCLFRGG
jgi:hypothetical protein